jgi:hypothetical protein
MRILALFSLFAVLALGQAAPASAATTCTARHKACLNVCATQYAKSGRCTGYCAEALPKCLSTGCWVSPQANECGHIKS